MHRYALLFLCLSFLAGCTNVIKIHYELPPDWKEESVRNQTIQKYSSYLSGKKFFIDPGHGGSDRKNQGKLGLVTEADVNLKVSLSLADYLRKAGATVYLSRDKDATVELKQRSILYNNSDADIFISIHHNATAEENDNWTNYTSTYYHAKETDYEYEPCNHDLAKYIQRDLAYVTDNSGGLGSFDGTYSDYNIYPKAGFSVLRLAKKPAVLIECDFFTNNYEEQRLSVDEFNQIQAWGIFRGLAKYFKAGVPVIIPAYDENQSFYAQEAKLEFTLKDKSGIDEKSIAVYVDSTQTDFIFNTVSSILNIDLSQKNPGAHTLRIICANKNGNYAFPFYRGIVIKPN